MIQKSKIKHFCNGCKYLNVSEEEQNEYKMLLKNFKEHYKDKIDSNSLSDNEKEEYYKLKHEVNVRNNHICECYRKRVIHNCTGPQHYKIFPCLECIKDNQEHYNA